MFSFVEEFFNKEYIPSSCNSCFITLIPKTDSPSSIKHHKQVSLIMVQYKIIVKLLANRLAGVIDTLVSPVQLTFVKGR